jgi:hypothetical protein
VVSRFLLGVAIGAALVGLAAVVRKVLVVDYDDQEFAG